MFSLQLIAWLIFSCVLMSFLEHQVHSKLMHKRNVLSSRFTPFGKMLEHHAVLHHGTYKYVFSDEPLPEGEDKGIRLSVQEGLVETLPITLIIALVSGPGAFIFVSVVALHHYLWNQIHLEMHKPESRYFSSWSAYKFLVRHHFMHHKYPHKNFNVVFPFADFVLRTNAPVSYSDVAEMYRLGFLRRRRNYNASLVTKPDVSG